LFAKVGGKKRLSILQKRAFAKVRTDEKKFILTPFVRDPTFYETIKVDAFVKSPQARHPREGGGP